MRQRVFRLRRAAANLADDLAFRHQIDGAAQQVVGLLFLIAFREQQAAFRRLQPAGPLGQRGKVFRLHAVERREPPQQRQIRGTSR
jgi:hypothetical protein